MIKNIPMLPAGQFHPAEVARIDHGDFFGHSELLCKLPAGCYAVVDHGNDLFGAYYSLGGGKYAGGDVAPTPQKAFLNALKDWAGERCNQSALTFRQIPKSAFGLFASAEAQASAVIGKGIDMAIEEGDMVRFSRFAYQDKLGDIKDAVQGQPGFGREGLGRVRARHGDYLMVEPSCSELKYALRSKSGGEYAMVYMRDARPAHTLSATQPILGKISGRIFHDICVAMQQAEELGGPESDDYRELMEAVRREAGQRLSNFKAVSPQSFRDGPTR